MKILISSQFFAPSVGGIEVVTELLAGEFALLGHEVRIVTQTTEADQCVRPFEVVRSPSVRALISHVQWCDLFLHSQLNMRAAWPLLFLRRPWVICHHTYFAPGNRVIGWRGHLRVAAMKRAVNVAVSEALAATVPVPCAMMANPYDDDIFKINAAAIRDRDLIFVGRIVSDKGLDLLLDALGILKKSGLTPNLTVVGNGPDLPSMKSRCSTLGLEGQVLFAGLKAPRDLAMLLNRHRMLVVPSRWAEPFGLVAVEAIACGCFVIASNQGGLPEAVGPLGSCFLNNDVAGLTELLLKNLLHPPSMDDSLREVHLGRFKKQAAAEAYIRLFEHPRKS